MPAPWHWAVLIVGVPVIAFFNVIGAYTVTTHVFRQPPPAGARAGPVHEPRPHAPDPATPAYDLAGYRLAATGPQEQAFASALNRVMGDTAHPDFVAAVSDAPRLVAAASRWLSLLRRTNPPPSYRRGKSACMLAAVVARRAGETTLGGLRTADLALLRKGAAQTARARRLLSRALLARPRIHSWRRTALSG